MVDKFVRFCIIIYLVNCINLHISLFILLYLDMGRGGRLDQKGGGEGGDDYPKPIKVL